jgi:Transposase DDE domain group 1
VHRHYAGFPYQAQSWSKPRRVVAKIGWHPGELYPCGGFFVTNLACGIALYSLGNFMCTLAMSKTAEP